VVSPFARMAGVAHAESEREIHAYSDALRDCVERIAARMPPWISNLCVALQDAVDEQAGPSTWGRSPADLPVIRGPALAVELLRAWAQTALASRMARVHIDLAWRQDPGRGDRIGQYLRTALRIVPGSSWILEGVEDEEARRLPTLFGSGLELSARAMLGGVRLGVACYAQVLSVLGIPHSKDMARRFALVSGAEDGIVRARLVMLLDVAQAWARRDMLGIEDDRRDCLHAVEGIVGVLRTRSAAMPDLSPLAQRAWSALSAWQDEHDLATALDPLILVNAAAIVFELRTALARENLRSPLTADDEATA